MKKVVNANCVNDKIVAHVEQRNASCFAALPEGKDNRTTDAWIRCMFDGLLGNRTAESPAIAGGLLNTFPQVAQLREKILDLWVGAFESDEMSSGGCPAVPSQNQADPPGGRAPTGVKEMTLYSRATDTTTDLTNRNTADEKAIVYDALYAATRPQLCAKLSAVSAEDGAAEVGGTEGGCALPESVLGAGMVGGVLTQASVAINTMHGQFGECSKDDNDNAWNCWADW
eukprot:COSAG04_NODE_870_length_9725_cov_3.580303_1_plen_228_part_00